MAREDKTDANKRKREEEVSQSVSQSVSGLLIGDTYNYTKI